MPSCPTALLAPVDSPLASIKWKDAIDKLIHGQCQEMHYNVFFQSVLRAFGQYDAVLVGVYMFNQFQDMPIQAVWTADFTERCLLNVEALECVETGPSVWAGTQALLNWLRGHRPEKLRVALEICWTHVEMEQALLAWTLANRPADVQSVATTRAAGRNLLLHNTFTAVNGDEFRSLYERARLDLRAVFTTTEHILLGLTTKAVKPHNVAENWWSEGARQLSADTVEVVIRAITQVTPPIIDWAFAIAPKYPAAARHVYAAAPTDVVTAKRKNGKTLAMLFASESTESEIRKRTRLE